MPNINLPKRFQDKLSEDQYLNGIVNTTLFTFGEILSDNKLYFFEEYTDHGNKHIEEVIFASNHLIPDETFAHILSTKDIAYYLLTVILHDIGMHIQPEGFLTLINGEFDTSRQHKLDEITWKEMWAEYLAEARKFDQKQLLSIFGKTDHLVNIPDLNQTDELNGHDRKLIGEFIRRHHPRLAHEIAINGFPGKNLIPFCKDLDEKDRNLIGLISRSHGADLRLCADHIEQIFSKNGKLLPLGIHAIYQMILLRISDYMQIDKSRTSITLLKIKTLSSPVSVKEHEAHLSIDGIDDRYQQDPERIYVSTSPQSSQMFFKLKSLFAGIQNELDRSWAVLGELYGSHAHRPQIRFRRINSNLEDVNFVRGLNFVPERLAFKANDELIKLLVAPLYGDDPSFGVRELLQNAVDACRERDVLDKGKLNYSPKVTISVKQEGEEFYFIMADNGLGMDSEVISKYFLTAGASFRNSQAWQKDFKDDLGQAKVNRNGRFGIGVLAAFLLGNEIEVRSRRYNKSIGYRFSATIHTEQIELKKDDSLDVGTTIKIKLTKDVFRRLDPNQRTKSQIVRWFEWYTQSRPSVNYYFSGIKIGTDNLNPVFEGHLPDEWHRIDSEGYNGIFWTYSNQYNTAKFTCNGIIIPQDPSTNGLKLGILPHLPKIHVLDNRGILPLNLSRNSFSSKLTFNEQLEDDLYKDFLAYLLTVKINSEIGEHSLKLVKQAFRHPGLLHKFSQESFSYGRLAYLNTSALSLPKYPLLGKEGFIVDYNFFVNHVSSLKVLYIQSDHPALPIINFDIDRHFIKFSTHPLSTIIDYKAVIEPKEHNYQGSPALFLVKEQTYEYLFKSDIRRLSTSVKNAADVIHKENGWVGLNFNLGRKPKITKNFLNENGQHINLIRDYDVKFVGEGNGKLNSVLERYLGKDVIIPYKLEDRKIRYPLAFNELARYMAKYLDN